MLPQDQGVLWEGGLLQGDLIPPSAAVVNSGLFSTFLSNFAHCSVGGLIPWEFSALPWLEAEEIARGVVLGRRVQAGRRGAGHICWDHQQRSRTVFVCVWTPGWSQHGAGPQMCCFGGPGQPRATEEGGGWAGQLGLGTG